MKPKLCPRPFTLSLTILETIKQKYFYTPSSNPFCLFTTFIRKQEQFTSDSNLEALTERESQKSYASPYTI